MNRTFVPFFLLLLLTATTFADDGDLDDLINSLFTKTPNAGSTPPPAPIAPPVGTQVVKEGIGLVRNLIHYSKFQAACESGQRCIQKYLCTNVSTSGEGLIDIRFDGDNPCVDYLLQCCYEEDIVGDIRL